MPHTSIRSVQGRCIRVPGDDIDTDRIIPARFLRCVTFDGLGEFAFYDERFDADGGAKGHPLDDTSRAGASVLLSGRNFGCGSSREHAPQSLLRFGFQALIAESFAEIFAGNCVGLGMVCVTLAAEKLVELAAAVDADPNIEVRVDLDSMMVSAGQSEWSCAMPASARQALLDGTYDPLDSLLAGADAVAEVEANLPYHARVAT